MKDRAVEPPGQIAKMLVCGGRCAGHDAVVSGRFQNDADMTCTEIGPIGLKMASDQAVLSAEDREAGEVSLWHPPVVRPLAA